LIYLFSKGVLLLGVERSTRLAERLGRWSYWLKGRERNRTLANLEKAFGDRFTLQERREIAQAVFSNAAITAVETVWMSRWRELSEWLTIEVVGEENLKEAFSRGKGVICFGGHLGSWEVQIAAMAQKGYQGYLIVRELKDPRLEKWVQEVRLNCGVPTLRRGRTPFRMIRTLKEGKALALVIDLDTRSGRGTFVEFFGRPAYTPTGAFELARMTGASLVPSICYRESLNRLRLVIGEPWVIDSTEDAEKDIQEATQRATRYLEEKISERPEQWMWFHNRWKTQPDHFEKKKRPSADDL
jgi:KDO2-lipid IV(A) lauroyltransferase